MGITRKIRRSIVRSPARMIASDSSAASNNTATGAPSITGATAEDETLTAVTSSITDADGLGEFSYQWQRDQVDIDGATSSTYVLTSDDVGAQMSVVVSFTDGEGNSESVTSAQTAAISAVNHPATGAPSITGTSTEGELLTADTSAIADADGLGAFSYQWMRDEVDISGATSSTYTLVSDDVGTQISVEVSFNDGDGNSESVTSSQTAVVAPANPYGNKFVLEIETTTSDETFVFTCQNEGTFDADIDWGDETSDAITAYNDSGLSHTFASAGTHLIQVDGDFPSLYMSNSASAAKIRKVYQLGVMGWLRLERAFFGATGLTHFTAGNTDTSNVVVWNAAFRDWTDIEAADFAGITTEAAEGMVATFRGWGDASVLPDVSSWDMTLCDERASMFRDVVGVIPQIGVEDWDISIGPDMDSFAQSSQFSTAAYDAILIGMEAQSPPTGMTAVFGFSQYTAGGAAEAARTSLTTTYTMTIQDNGTA